MSRRSVAIAVLGMAVSTGARAQSVPVVVFNDVVGGLSDLVAVWTSPFRGSGSDYLTAGMVLGGAGVLSLADDEIGRWIYEHPEHGALKALEPFREDSWTRLIDLGGAKHVATYTAAMYVTGLVAGSADLRDAAVGCFASVQANAVPRSFVYGAISRERPLYMVIENGDTLLRRRGDPHSFAVPGEDTWYDNSFFGGHGANIMGCASFINHRFDLGFAEPVIWGVAVAVNVGRMADQRHWTSDTAVGSAIGFAIGKYVAERQRARAERREARGEREQDDGGLLSGVFVEPGARGGTVVGWRKRF